MLDKSIFVFCVVVRGDYEMMLRLQEYSGWNKAESADYISLIIYIFWLVGRVNRARNKHDFWIFERVKQNKNKIPDRFNWTNI